MRKKYTQLPVEKHTDRTEIRRHAQALVIVAYSTGVFACSSSGGVITVKGWPGLDGDLFSSVQQKVIRNNMTYKKHRL